MIFLDGRRAEYWRRVRLQLGQWAVQDLNVLDVACGFGKFADVFVPLNYVGIDFSDEMIALAKKEKALYHFERTDVKEWKPPGTFDVIYEINSLRSLGLTADGFVNLFRPYATMAIATLEADEFRITQLYPDQRR